MQNLTDPPRQLLSISPRLLVVSISYAAGICLAKQFALTLETVLICVLPLLGLLSYLCKFNIQPQTRISIFLLGFLFFLLGLLRYYQSQPDLSLYPHHIYNLIQHNQTATIEGTLTEYPSVGNIPEKPKTKLLVKVRGLCPDISGHYPQIQNNRKTSGLILLTLNGLLPEDIVPGDHILVKGNLSRIHTYSTPGSFNYKEYMESQSIYVTGWVQSPQNIIKIYRTEPAALPSFFTNLYYLPEQIRTHLAVFLKNTLQQPARGLYKAILIGDRNDVPLQILNNFKASGCLHILAISGMHMGLLALMTIAFISWLLKRSTWIMLRLPTHKIALFIAFFLLFSISINNNSLNSSYSDLKKNSYT